MWSAWFQHFDYDPFGNVYMSGTQSFLPTYDESTNRYYGLPNGGTPRYDRDGNVLHDGFHNYTWTADGQNATITGGGISSVTYDAMGRWVERTHPDGSHDQAVYAPQGGTPLFIANAGTLKTGYLHLPGNGSLTYYATGTLLYGHPDWLGTGRLFSNGSRQVTADTAIAPFGQQYANTGSTDGFFTGVGQSTEATDVQTFPARLYHPGQGRWLTPDPAGLNAVDLTNPRTWNRYVYVANNPLSNVDPTGKWGNPVGATCTWDASYQYQTCSGPNNLQFPGCAGCSSTAAPTGLSNQAGINNGFGGRARRTCKLTYRMSVR